MRPRRRSLAYFLKNRIYLGETNDADKWFEGEHEDIIDHKTFEQVQQLLKANSNGRKAKRSESGAPAAWRESSS